MSLAKKHSNNVDHKISDKRLSFKEKFADPNFVLEEMAKLLKEGDVSASTDLIAAYIAYSPKYKGQEEFAEAIGTTRQTLHRMFAHENVSLNVFFGAIERIFEDSKNK